MAKMTVSKETQLVADMVTGEVAETIFGYISKSSYERYVNAYKELTKMGKNPIWKLKTVRKPRNI